MTNVRHIAVFPIASMNIFFPITDRKEPMFIAMNIFVILSTNLFARCLG